MIQRPCQRIESSKSYAVITIVAQNKVRIVGLCNQEKLVRKS